MATPTHDSDALGSSVLTIALIGPEQQRRSSVAIALAGLQAGLVRELAAYPGLDEVPRMLQDHYDVVMIDLDSNPEYALDLVETICAGSPATVMVYSTQTESELLVRCMRAGAREFLTQPFAPGAIGEALVRASVRRPMARCRRSRRRAASRWCFSAPRAVQG